MQEQNDELRKHLASMERTKDALKAFIAALRGIQKERLWVYGTDNENRPLYSSLADYLRQRFGMSEQKAAYMIDAMACE